MTRPLGVLTMVVAGAGVGVAGATAIGSELSAQVKMKTTLGDIVLELDGAKAPITVQNFLQYTDASFYSGTVFHRVMKNFMIQGGQFTAEMDKKTEGLRPAIKNEWKNGLKNVRGTIAMARGPAADSATSQFFINVVDNPSLDQPRGGAAYAVFGRVIEGMETVEKIRNTEVTTHLKYERGSKRVVPTVPVVVEAIEIVRDVDRKKLQAAVDASGTAQGTKPTMTDADTIKKIVAKAEKEHNTKAVTTDSGLMYIDMVVGDGPTPSGPSQRVEVHYTAWLLDGTKFDSSVDRGKPSSFSLNGVISGWTEGVGSMKVGGKRKLIIPPNLAYGAAGRPSIPPNSTLVFDVELLELKGGGG